MGQFFARSIRDAEKVLEVLRTSEQVYLASDYAGRGELASFLLGELEDKLRLFTRPLYDRTNETRRKIVGVLLEEVENAKGNEREP